MKIRIPLKALSLALLCIPSALSAAATQAYPYGTAFKIEPMIANTISSFLDVPTMLMHRREVSNCLASTVYSFGDEELTLAAMAARERASDVNTTSAAYREFISQVVNRLVNVNRQSLVEAQQAPEINRMFLESWAKQTGHQNSDLLASEGKTVEDIETHFRSLMTNACRLERFCKDLVTFIDDILKSFPDAWTRFVKRR